MKRTRLTITAAITAMSGLMAGAAYAACGGTYCTSNSGYSNSPYIVPAPVMRPAPMLRSATVSNISNLSISGLGMSERLCPVKCPVNVDIPLGGRVLDCYAVCKPVAPVRVMRPQLRTHSYQVVRPVIYVRYPVPTPVIGVPVPVPTRIGGPVYGSCGGGYGGPSRYGFNSQRSYGQGGSSRYGNSYSYSGSYGGGYAGGCGR